LIFFVIASKDDVLQTLVPVHYYKG
jgi:hypothetical protein